ncbi:thiol reductant ABC exporter subunit CydC [Schaalia sp. Marseille-Q2122]|uniref:thiol reductant ABC exporter subunit CydC n=1 Tax=Schaalia sp. Marseille-Q2122 TaxID=2736604 RepID=UPI0015893C6A|nr:thiol reductant ABC exporter subunit CydC [Schaalia sp. Marseille-Q2122]
MTHSSTSLTQVSQDTAAKEKAAQPQAAQARIPHTRWELSLRLLQVARSVIAPLGLSMIFRLLALLAGAALFGIGGWALASRMAEGAEVSLWTIAAALIGLSLAKGVLRYLEQYSGHYVAFRSLALLRNYFYDALEPQAPAQTEGLDSGDLMSRVTKDVDRIEVFFAHTLAPIVTAVIAPIIMLSYLGVAVSWQVALTLLPFLLVVGVVVPLLGSKATDAAAAELRRARGTLAHHVTDSVQGVREVLAFGYQEARLAEMGRIEERITRGLKTTMGYVAVRRGLNQGLLAGTLVAVFAMGAHQVAAGVLTPGQVGLALGVALGAFAPVLAVEDFVADLDQAYASARRVFSITERTPLVADPAQPRDTEVDASADLIVEGVSFTYPAVDAGAVNADPVAEAERPQVLHDVNVRLAAGKMTAIVGASGSGKSTLAALLDRMWDPTAGSVRIGEVDLRELSLEHLRNLVSYAPQRPHVFNDSIRANLLLARPDATDADLDRVCAQVGLSEWIASEPDGMNTVVGEMGERLSGGQRQRLAVARALLRETPITILDEATSQIDAATEKTVLEGIAQATDGRTLVVIAHRISTIENADHIIVMDGGRVVEEGTYAELMASGGALAALAQRE